MINVVGVRFKTASKIYYFDPGKKFIQLNDNVIVETVRGVEFGEIVVGPKDIEDDEIVTSLKPVLRVATNEDKRINQENKQMEKEAFDLCLEKIELHELVMKLIDVEYTFDRNKIIFYFTADGRVDFRELVKDLAAVFKTRIELRQIGVRDEAKMIGGLGPCGRPLCCKQFLNEFCPVSIKMAKEQNLSLNPTKISGICSRLMCCLNYEHEGYEENLKLLPNAGAKVVDKYTDRQGVVLSINVLALKVRVKFFSKDGGDEITDVSYDDLIYINNKSNKNYEDRLKAGAKNLEKSDNENKKVAVKKDDKSGKADKSDKKNQSMKNNKNNKNSNKDNKTNKDIVVSKDKKIIKDNTSNKEKKITKDRRPNRENRPNKENKPNRENKPNKENRPSKENKVTNQNKNNDSNKENKDNKNNRFNRENKPVDSENNKQNKANNNDKTNKDNKNAYKNSRNTRNRRDNKNVQNSMDNLSIEKRIEMELVKRRDDRKKADLQKKQTAKKSDVKTNNDSCCGSNGGCGSDSGCGCANGSGCGSEV